MRKAKSSAACHPPTVNEHEFFSAQRYGAPVAVEATISSRCFTAKPKSKAVVRVACETCVDGRTRTRIF